MPQTPEISQQELFRSLPKVDEVLAAVAVEDIPTSVLLISIRETLGALRTAISERVHTTPVSIEEVCATTITCATLKIAPSMRRVINATGIIVHTNLGRSVLAPAAVKAAAEAAGAYSTLEYDYKRGVRGSRHDHTESLLCELTGAEAAMAVNNNAAAVMMCIASFSRNKEALVSRGQLVEIGGSFRVPDIMAESGAKMVEVGTTNKTHAADYENAITEETGLLLKVHSSNYRVVGFTSEVTLEELVSIGAKHNVAVMEDQGSGVLIDLRKYGIPYEPTVGESVAAGATVVTFSGDKLLGGPQAGIIVGTKDAIAQLKKHPMARALRLDKMTLAALEATLMLYRDEATAVREIPTLRALTMSAEECRTNTERFAASLTEALTAHNLRDAVTIEVLADVARAGGGSLPLADIPTFVAALQFEGISVDAVERALRLDTQVPIVARIHDDRLLFDTRTFVDGDAHTVIEELCRILSR